MLATRQLIIPKRENFLFIQSITHTTGDKERERGGDKSEHHQKNSVRRICQFTIRMVVLIKWHTKYYIFSIR